MDKVIKVINLLKIAIIFAFGLFSTAGYSLSSDWAISEKSKVRLISPMTASNNNQLILALEYELEDEWKTYWKSPGGGGFPQKIIWNNSSNVKDIKILWPEPIEFEILGLKSIGYKDKVIFPLIVDLEDNQKQTNLNLNINYLVCKDVCIPGSADIFLNIPSGDGEYTDYFFEIEKVLSTTLNNNIDFTPISNFSFKAIENNNSVIFDIEISTTSFFDDPKIFIHTPFGLPVVEPINNYSLDFQKLNTSLYYSADQFNEKKFPIEIFFYDNNHSFKVEKSVEIENVDENQLICEFLLAHPKYRGIVKRIQSLKNYPYSEVQDNVLDRKTIPIDMLRFKLSFFGANRYDPKSDRWLRVSFFSGAPYLSDLNNKNVDEWGFATMNSY